MSKVIKPYPKSEIICKYVRNLHSQTIDLLDLNKKSISELHNIYTNYCVTMHLHLTAHRPVIDPICYAHEIDCTNQLLLINDKVVKDNAEYRLVAIPDTARDQYENYLDHLEYLITRLHRMKGKNRILALAISPILTKEKQYTPQFFYIDEKLENTYSIHPSKIQKLLHLETWFKDNMGRHILATSILNTTQNADWSMIQLGHLEACEHPFGITSELIPSNTLAKIRQSINKITSDFGWKAIKSPLPKIKSKSNRKITASDNRKIQMVHKSGLFGPEARKKKRALRFDKHRNVVKYAVISFGVADKKNNYTTEIHDSIIETIHNVAADNKLSVNYCLLIFYRWLQAKKFNGQWKSYFKRVFQIEKEHSPFISDTLRDYQKILKARERFLKYLDESQQNNQITTPAKRIAEIIISAGLFSYFANKMRLKDIIDALHKRLYQYNNQLFLDIKCIEKAKDSTKNIFRWYPDTTSHLLITGLERSSTPPLKTQINQELKSLLNKLIPGIPKKDPLSHFCKINTAALTIELPGYVVPIAQGKSNTVSIPIDSFTRIMSGKRLIPITTQDRQKKSIPYAWTLDINKFKSTITYKQTQSFQKALRKAFITADKEIGSDTRSKSNKQKTKLVSLIDKLLSDTTNFGPTCFLIGAWVIHICKHRTQYGNNLVFNTIYEYTNIISRGLIQVAFNKNILELFDLELEELYIESAYLFPASRRAEAIGRFHEFHHFLSQFWPVEDPDWNTVYVESECDYSSNLANANIITEKEFIRMIEGINRSESLSKLRKHQYITLLSLGFRFGLRFSEAYQLQYRDLQYDIKNKTFAVSIHNSRHGGIKSPAGIRKIGAVPLERINEIEIHAIKSLLIYFETGFEADYEIGLFANSISDINLIPKTQTSIDIHQVIRYVTGDSKLRFHHLRHSWSNRIFNKSEHYLQWTSDDPFFLTKYFVSNQIQFKSEAVNLKELSRVIGHSSEETSIVNYLHSLDSVLYEYSCKLFPKLSPKAIAYALNISHDAIRQQLSRSGGLLERLPALKNNAISMPLPLVELTEIDPHYVFTPTKQQLSALSLLNINDMLLEASKANINISEKLLLDELLVENFIKQALTIEKNSGYNRFKLYNRCLSTSDDEQQVVSSFNNRTEEKRTKEILKHLDSIINRLSDKQHHSLDKFIALWTNDYEPDIGQLLVHKKDEIVDIINGCSIISENKIRLNIYCPPDSEDINLEEYKNVDVSKKIIRFARAKTDFHKKQRYLVKFNLEQSKYKTIINFHRIMFCLSINQALHKDKLL